MMLKNLFAKVSLIAVLLLFLGTTANAQLQKVYVDISIGNDITNSGANADNSVINAGPVKTIGQALTLVADNGTISIAASTAGLYEYGAINLTTKKNLTLEARVAGPFTKVSVTSITVNQADYTKTFTAEGSASFEVQTGITLTAGNFSMASSAYMSLANNATISVAAGDAAFTNAAPTKGSNLNLTYTGSKSATAGQEGAYGSYGSGLLTFNNTAGTVTINNSVTFAKIVVSDNGSAKIDGSVTLGTGSIVTTATKTGNLTITGNLSFDFKASPVAVGYTSKTNAVPSVLTFGAAPGYAVGDVIYISGDADGMATGYYDVTAVGGATVTISNTGAPGGTGVGNTTLPVVGRIRNLGGGAVTVSGTTTWNNNDASNIAAAQFLGYIVDNNPDVNTGNVTLGNITIGSDKDGDMDAVIYNRRTANNGGALTIGSITATGTETSSGSGVFKYGVVNLINNTAASTGKFISGGGDIRGAVTNVSTGSFSFNGIGTVYGNFVNTAAGSVSFASAVSFKGNFTNSSTGKITVNETVTLSGASSTFSDGGAAGEVAIANGKEFAISNSTNNITHNTSAEKFTNNGYLAFYGSKTKTLNGSSKITNLKIDAGSGLVTIPGLTTTVNVSSAANFALTGAASVSGTFTLSSGTLTFGTGAGAMVLTVKNFTQTGGTFAVETSGARTMTVQGDFSRTGGAFQPSTMVFNVAGLTNQSISPGATMKVGDVTFNSPVQTITVDGSIESAGDFSITQYTTVNLGSNVITLTKNGAVANNAGTYNSVGGGGIMFSGNSGNLRGTSPYSNIIVNLSAAAGNVSVANESVKWTGQLTLNAGGIDVNGPDLSPSGSSAKIVRNLVSATTDITVTAGTFNADAANYDLEYIGTLGAATLVGSEFNSTNVRDVTVSTVNVVGKETTLPNAANKISGNLSVAKTAIVDMGAAGTLELTKDGGVHSIKGWLYDGLIISGATATLTGYLSSGDVGDVTDLTLSSTTLATVSGIGVLGALTTGSNSVVNFSQIEGDYVAGLVTLGGTTFTLGSPLEFRGGIQHNKGTVEMGDANNLSLTTGGAYTRANDASAVYSSTGAKVIFAQAMNANFNAGSIPYLEASAVVTLQSDVTISNLLNLKAGGQLAGAFKVNILDQFTNAVATPIPAGTLVLKGTTVTTSADMTVLNLTVNSSATSVAVIKSDDEAATTPTKRTITVTGVFTQTVGDINPGRHDIVLTGSTGDVYARAAGNIIQTSGALVFAPAANANVTFNPGTDCQLRTLQLTMLRLVIWFKLQMKKHSQ
jgi:fibronectin-binding autotransporter adhesin